MAAGNGQHVAQIAEGIGEGVTLAGGVDMPAQRVLMGFYTWRQTQLLNRVGQRRRVAIQGFVADGESHLGRQWNEEFTADAIAQFVNMLQELGQVVVQTFFQYVIDGCELQFCMQLAGKA